MHFPKTTDKLHRCWKRASQFFKTSWVVWCRVWLRPPCNPEPVEETCHENQVGKNRPEANANQMQAKEMREPSPVRAIFASCWNDVQVAPPGSASGSRPRWNGVFESKRSWMIWIFWTIAKITDIQSSLWRLGPKMEFYFSDSLLREAPKDSQALCRHSAWH